MFQRSTLALATGPPGSSALAHSFYAFCVCKLLKAARLSPSGVWERASFRLFADWSAERGAEDESVWSHGNRQLGMELWATQVTGRTASSATLARAHVHMRCYGNSAGKSIPGRSRAVRSFHVSSLSGRKTGFPRYAGRTQDQVALTR